MAVSLSIAGNRFRTVVAAGAVGLIPACTDAGSATPAAVATVVVSPAVIEVAVGDSAQLTADALDDSGNDVAGVSPTWTSNAMGVASVSSTGMVRGLSAGGAVVSAAVGSVVGQSVVQVTPVPPAGPVVLVTPEVRYQSMTGWEAVAQIGEQECNQTAFPLYQGPLLDAAVNDLGINRLRLELRSGLENPVDWFARFQRGEINEATLNSHRYDIVNDNPDPTTENAAGFQWSQLDFTVDRVVTPLRQRLAARGERLFVNLTYVDFAPSPFEHSANAAEYGELLLAAFRHLQGKYAWTPDAVEVILEPDNTSNWRPQTIGAAIVASGDRLAAAGFRPAFIAPSNTSMSGALQYFDQLVTAPRVREYLTDFAYHRYSGVSSSTLAQIGARAVTFGVRTGMLEHIGSGHEDLHDDIETGRVSSWEQFTLAYCDADNGAHYFSVNQSNPSAPVVTLGATGRYLRHYFRHVRLGAVRIGAASGDQRFAPLAFRNEDGRTVVVIKASEGGSIQVRGLPAGTYGRFYTTSSQSDVRLADVAVASGGDLAVTIPAAGVLTVHRR